MVRSSLPPPQAYDAKQSNVEQMVNVYAELRELRQRIQEIEREK